MDLEEIPSAETILGWLKEELHSTLPWEVQHHPYHSEIEAFIEKTGRWEIIATIKCENHIAIANTIRNAVNKYTQTRDAANDA